MDYVKVVRTRGHGGNIESCGSTVPQNAELINNGEMSILVYIYRIYTVEPPLMDPPRSGQPLYSGLHAWQLVTDLAIYTSLI